MYKGILFSKRTKTTAKAKAKDSFEREKPRTKTKTKDKDKAKDCGKWRVEAGTHITILILKSHSKTQRFGLRESIRFI